MQNMTNKAKVFIDPTSRVLYSSYYIKGLVEVFGKKRVSFSAKHFKGLKRELDTNSYDHYMAFVVVNDQGEKSNYIIDFRDKASVKENAYDWCDKYAKINFNKKQTPKKFHPKICAIPPGFGIKIWTAWETTYYCVSNFFKSKCSPIVSLKRYFADYYNQYKRAELDDYTTADVAPEQGEIPYVFMIATLWPHENCIKGTNLIRKKFIESCQQVNCNFEGGFFASETHPQYEEFKGIIFTQRYSIDSYLKKNKQSAIVFNTPAVHDCHGWKLGEYFAMGKVILTTPISNELPEALEHDKNVHIVPDPDRFGEAIEYVLENEDYRKILEEGAKAYYAEYAKPGSVIRNVLKETKCVE